MEQQVETKSGKILAALGRPKTAKELMDDTGLPKVTLYRYLNKLIESGQVQRLEGGYYVLAGEHPRLETVGQATKMVNEVKTLPIVDEQYFLDEKIANDYKPIKVNNIDLHDLLDWCLENNQPVILQGPTGWGKTFSVLSFAAKRRIPIVIVQASSSVEYDELVAVPLIMNHETVIKYCSLAIAFKLAKKYKRAILLIEEINTFDPKIQKELNSLTDIKRMLVVELTGEVLRLNDDDAKLLIVGTMNPSSLGYGGVNQLSLDLKSRFILVDINADKEQAFKVVGDKAQKWLDVVMELNKLALVTHQPGIRDVIQLTKLEQEFGEKFALEVLISKYDHDEREQVKMVVKRLAKGDESEVE